jgi:GDP-mannose 6-dehydrogenase
MRLLCQDTRLNVSPAYLRPGFAFGGSCLPKDLRALLHMARVNSIDLPLLQGTEATNVQIVRNITREVLYTTHKRVAMLGLSFKAETDDLRESPYVELAESLLGKGLEVQIYDPVIRPERLIGGNLRYVDDHLPHLRRLLVDTPEEALAGAEVVLVASSSDEVKQALLSSAPPVLIDLVGSLGPEVEALPGYRGVSW